MSCKGCGTEMKVIVNGFKRLQVDITPYMERVLICAGCPEAKEGYCMDSGLFIAKLIVNEYCGKWESSDQD